MGWVWQEPLARLCGGKNLEERRAALRTYTEGAVHQGGVEAPWKRVVDGLARIIHKLRGRPTEWSADLQSALGTANGQECRFSALCEPPTPKAD